ncbi:autotransporter-associated beta strand repeat-containing protein [Verrucomicrobium sp. GAS474]|uniref:beta strand repeat-containing protein n=1 Tax=Verrucomicrobium sp. GAS474 TaxID=1882831 RepID=UPI00087D1D6D|nr:autotransporter-associated beta strand repeat-containing protein [Verrucomicrobium sp. GAS474]SDU05940.1 autotransporter-associated beta strand repeat-containing protein [Verrucomicrobium sp. GAS474]
MKILLRWPVLALVLVSLTSAVPGLRAATVTWDATSGTTGAQDGTGAWSSSSTAFWNGSADVTAGTSDTVTFGSATSLAAAYTVTLGGNVTVGNLAFSYSGANNYTIAGSTYTITLGGAGGTGAATITATSGTSTAIAPVISANLANSGGLSLVGGSATLNSSLTFSGTNTFSGGLTLGDGTNLILLTANSQAALGTGAVTINPNATLRLNGSFITSSAQTISLAGGTGDGGRGLIDLYGNGSGVAGTVTLTGNASRIRIDVLTGTISGNIGESGGSQSLEYYGGTVNNVLSITGNNTYSGGTLVTAGSSGKSFTVAVSADSAFGAVPASASTNLTFAGTGTTVLQATGSFTLNAKRNIVLSSAGHTFDTQAYNLTIGGVVSGTTPVSKIGSGTLTLAGANTYTGATSVSAGTLSVTGSLANTAVSVASGATLTGTGTIAGATTVASGGTLAAGTATGTSLTLANGLTMASGSTLAFVLGSGNTSSTLTLGGTASLASTLYIDLLNIQAGTYSNIITGLASDPGESGWTLTSDDNGYSAQFSYSAGNLSVTVVAVPEPPVAALLGAFGTVWGAGGLLRRRLFRRKGRPDAGAIL